MKRNTNNSNCKKTSTGENRFLMYLAYQKRITVAGQRRIYTELPLSDSLGVFWLIVIL